MSDLAELVARALREDIGDGDLTSAAVVPEEARARAVIEQREPGVIFGLEAARETFAQVDHGLQFELLADEGRWRDPARIAEIEGPARSLLAGERVALNFLGRLSGIATLTARYVKAVEGTGARILDTRKTTPGLRALEKQAVVAGGGVSHRDGLHDAILVKENHAALAGGVGEAARRAVARGDRREWRGGGDRAPRPARGGAGRRRRPRPARQHDARTSCASASRWQRAEPRSRPRAA